MPLLPVVLNPVVTSKYKTLEKAEVAVTVIDPRSMIPSQSGRDNKTQRQQPKIRAKHSPMLPTDRAGLTKGGGGSPKQTTKKDLKDFHKAQAQQYEEFVRRQEQTIRQHNRVSPLVKSKRSGIFFHEHSRSTINIG